MSAVRIRRCCCCLHGRRVLVVVVGDNVYATERFIYTEESPFSLPADASVC